MCFDQRIGDQVTLDHVVHAFEHLEQELNRLSAPELRKKLWHDLVAARMCFLKHHPSGVIPDEIVQSIKDNRNLRSA
jgi:hypothetical protein